MLVHQRVVLKDPWSLGFKASGNPAKGAPKSNIYALMKTLKTENRETATENSCGGA